MRSRCPRFPAWIRGVSPIRGVPSRRGPIRRITQFVALDQSTLGSYTQCLAFAPQLCSPLPRGGAEVKSVEQRIRILVVEREPLRCLGLQSALRGSRDIDLLGVLHDHCKALDRTRKERPHVLFIGMTGVTGRGLDLIRQSRKLCADIRVIVHYREASPTFVHHAFSAGASGFVAHDCDPVLLPTIIRMVARGEVYLAPASAAALIEAAGPPSPQGVDNHLSLQETRILRFIAEGCTSKEIANKLGLSTRTVDAHRANIMRRIDVHTTAGLTRYAIRQGILEPT